MTINIDTHGESGTIVLSLEDTLETAFNATLSGKMSFDYTLYLEPS